MKYRIINKFENDQILSYIELNSYRRIAISEIHGLRAGANYTEEFLLIKHRTRSPRCLKYEEEAGEVEHRIERCGAYELKRQILKEYLQKKLEADIKRLKLADIVLNSNEF